MKSNRLALSAKIFLLSLAFALSGTAQPRSAPQLNGELRQVEGSRILRVWGTPRQRGYAHGYLLAEDIVKLLDGYLSETSLGSNGPEKFEARSREVVQRMRIAPQYEAELRGLLAGMRARIGEKARIALLDRPLQYEDLVAVTCIPEMAQLGCSSFAAWGALTADGGTLAGRNLDWHRLPALLGTGVIVAAIPAANSHEHATVSITWPGFIGGLTMMNNDGVAISMHDVYCGPPKVPFGFTPRALALRECAETADAKTASQDVLGLLTTRIACVGNNFTVVSPFAGGSNPPAVVMEYDGDILSKRGVTMRQPDPSDSGAAVLYQACTNHYRARKKPESCDRYQKLDTALSKLEKSGGKLTVDDGWKLLQNVACSPNQRIETFHSVIFEPNHKRIHVAFSTADQAAPFARPITLDLPKLLQLPGSVAAGTVENP